MTEDDDKVKRLNVRFKKPPAADGPMLRIVDPYDRDECNHRFYFVDNGSRSRRMRNVQYLIRQGETEVECGHCGTRLDPMFVLKVLATEETQWEQTRAVYQEEMKRLESRQRTKCEHCDKMTRISRR